MKVILDIKKPNKIEKQFISDLKKAFNEVRLFEKGEKKLKKIKQVLDEL